MQHRATTVIIPAYKAATTIRRTLESVAEQTRQPDQVLVIDDGSPDGAALAAVVARFPFATLLRKPNGGAASARNYGIDNATGDWIAFLDADDYWLPTKLERQLSIAEAHTDVGVIGCRWREEPGDDRPARIRYPEFYGRRIAPSGYDCFLAAMCVWTGSVMIRHDVIGSERFISGLEPAEDRDLWIRVMQKAPTYMINDVLAVYVQIPGSLSNANVDRDGRSMLRVIDRHSQLMSPGQKRQQEAIVLRRMASGHLANGRAKKALKPAINRLGRDSLSPEAWYVAAKASVLGIVGR